MRTVYRESAPQAQSSLLVVHCCSEPLTSPYDPCVLAEWQFYAVYAALACIGFMIAALPLLFCLCCCLRRASSATTAHISSNTDDPIKPNRSGGFAEVTGSKTPTKHCPTLIRSDPNEFPPFQADSNEEKDNTGSTYQSLELTEQQPLEYETLSQSRAESDFVYAAADCSAPHADSLYHEIEPTDPKPEPIYQDFE
ncbi:hypothetical protein AOLI_G00068270 [Acnodon oligacanthus]